MSVNIDFEVARPGDDSYVEQAWQLKEHIRREEDVLKQRKGFFTDAYRRSTVRLLAPSERGGSLVTRRCTVERR